MSGDHGRGSNFHSSIKSELLRTLVASLDATHSPDEVNLVLVDFKGGATFLGCEGLPHTSAVITNLANEAVRVERLDGHRARRAWLDEHGPGPWPPQG